VNDWTGIAGYSGSGKSTVARLLAGPSAVIIDADIEAKKFISGDRMLHHQLTDIFGDSILEGGEINFGTLGRAVFSSKYQLQKYNAIVHPPVLEYLQNLLHRQGDRSVVFDAALIPLWGIESWFDSCVWVSASFTTRCLRIKSRNGNLDPASVENRLRIQQEVMKEPEGDRWVRIENEGRPEDLARSVSGLHIN
jgi:dephospho-CoA kinase